MLKLDISPASARKSERRASAAAKAYLRRNSYLAASFPGEICPSQRRYLYQLVSCLSLITAVLRSE